LGKLEYCIKLNGFVKDVHCRGFCCDCKQHELREYIPPIRVRNMFQAGNDFNPCNYCLTFKGRSAAQQPCRYCVNNLDAEMYVREDNARSDTPRDESNKASRSLKS